MANVLVLEDMDAFRRLLTYVLSSAGHTVTESCNGEIVYEVGALDETDVMITDLNMPWVNGIEAILEARKANPGLKVIAMSGGSLNLANDYLMGCLKLGACSVLHKPFEPDEMLKCVKEALAA